MKCYSLCFLLLISITANSQKCVFIANSVSGMDGSRLLITEPSLLSKDFANGNLQVYSSLYDNESVMLSFIIKSDADINYSAEDNVQLELANGDTLLLPIHKQPVVSTSPHRKLSINILLNTDQEKLLIDNFVLRISFKGGTMDLDAELTKKTYQRLISDKVECIAGMR